MNGMVRGMGLCGVDWGGVEMLSLGLGLVLGDCVWCVLLPGIVANATISSKTTPPVSHN